jgi:hypothetical protein
MEVVERREMGNEFQMVGAEKEKERWPMEVLIRGRKKRN